MAKNATIVVFSSDLDRVLAAFNIATGAAVSGMKVTMFFTFWGLNVIRKDRFSLAQPDMVRKAFAVMNRGGARGLKLSRFNMLGMGTGLLKRLMNRLRMPGVVKMIEMADELGVRLVACTTTMGLMAVKKEELIPEVKGYAGVATYIEEARQGEINLFI